MRQMQLSCKGRLPLIFNILRDLTGSSEQKLQHPILLCEIKNLLKSCIDKI